MAFLVALGAAAVAAAVTTFAFNLYFNSLLSSQEGRNERLRAEIRELDKQIEQINDLEQQKQNFIARMQVIEKLQRSRPEIVHVFDELARTLPEGAYLTGVKQTNARLKIDGVAQSSTRVSTFMRNIDGSQWLRNPELDIVETKPNQPLGANFTLFADQVSVSAEEASEAKGAKAGKGGKPGKDDPKANGKRARQASAQASGEGGKK